MTSKTLHTRSRTTGNGKKLHWNMLDVIASASESPVRTRAWQLLDMMLTDTSPFLGADMPLRVRAHAVHSRAARQNYASSTHLHGSKHDVSDGADQVVHCVEAADGFAGDVYGHRVMKLRHSLHGRMSGVAPLQESMTAVCLGKG